MIDYDAYIADYNLNDDRRTAGRWYAPDIVVIDGFRKMEGRDRVLAFLLDGHDGVHETLLPTLVMKQDDCIFAELAIEFMPQRDRPDHPLGPLTKGAAVKMIFFARYRIVRGMISELRLAYWPPNSFVEYLTLN